VQRFNLALMAANDICPDAAGDIIHRVAPEEAWHPAGDGCPYSNRKQ
jgi:hypothetical protein